MADCIDELITANLETALGTVRSYPDSTAPTVERERTVLAIGNRYPFIELSGPWSEAENQTYKVDVVSLYFLAKYYVKKNDESTTADTELPYLTRNVCADMTKAIMTDQTRGGYALFTRVSDRGYDFDMNEDTGSIEFYRYIVIHVQARIDAADPYELA